MSRKNLASVGGKPLIAWSIEAARASRYPLRVVVSTDDEEIARVARSYGAEVPFLRPAEFACDAASGEAVVLHALEALRVRTEWEPELVAYLQPTSPLRSTEDIDASIARLDEMHADSVISVTPADRHPYLLKEVDEAGWLRPFLPEARAIRRQDLPPVYALNGAIYLARTKTFVEAGGWYAGRTCAYVMPPERSLDIDTAFDLRVADLLLASTAQ